MPDPGGAVPAYADIDPAWWTTAEFEGRPMRGILCSRDVGAVFRFLARRGWSRARIGAATGLSETRVRAVARGSQQVSSYEVLERIADGLHIDRGLVGLAFTTANVPSSSATSPTRASRSAARIDAAVSDKVITGPEPTNAVEACLPALRRVLDAYDLPDDGPVRPLGDLQDAVARVVRCRLDSEYGRLAIILPGLLAELHRAIHHYVGQRRLVVAESLTQAYRAADALADKFGLFDLSARVILMMTSAASQSGDELLMATAAYVRAETHFATGDHHNGRLALVRAADRLMPGSGADSAAVYGALHMRAAVMAARAGHFHAAADHLDEARTIASGLRESIYYGTAFGPASVRIHQLTLAVDSADIGAALQAADGWTPPLYLPAERRSHFYVDLARAHAQAGSAEAALVSLDQARQIAPQHIRAHPDAHRLVTALAQADTADTQRLRRFAAWLRPRTLVRSAPVGATAEARPASR